MIRAKAVGFGLVRHVTLSHIFAISFEQTVKNSVTVEFHGFECSSKIRNRKLETKTDACKRFFNCIVIENYTPLNVEV